MDEDDVAVIYEVSGRLEFYIVFELEKDVLLCKDFYNAIRKSCYGVTESVFRSPFYMFLDRVTVSPVQVEVNQGIEILTGC